jgi:hypothetical protein
VMGLLLLGVLRQTALSLPSPARSAASSGPPVGDRLPKAVLAEVTRALSGELENGALVAFVMQSCVACQRLLGELTHSNVQVEQPIVLVAKNASAQFRSALAETALPTVYDNGGLWKEARITSTPLVLKIDRDGRVVAKGVTHHVDNVARPA